MGFAERLLEVIDSGRRTATYKLVLLMALLDPCARHSDAEGRAPVTVARHPALSAMVRSGCVNRMGWRRSGKPALHERIAGAR